jgi:4-phytase/acid phosphatase
MTSRFRVGWFAAALCCGLIACAAAAEPAHLVRVVVLQRHGVRAPAAAADRLLKSFGRPTVAWSVPPGELSPHGAGTMRLMGAHLRAVYAADGLFPATGCPGSDPAFVWADNAYERTRASGDALLAGMFPGCEYQARYAPLTAPDPIFSPPDSKLCPPDPAAEQAAILAEAGGTLAALRPSYAGALDALQRLLDPNACKPNRISGACLADAPDRLEIKGKGVRIEGALADGSTLSEALFLSYAEGQPGLSAADVAAIMPLHEIFARILRRPTDSAAQAEGPLVRALLAALADGSVPALDPAAPAPTAARYVTFLGHDVDLSHLAALLGVDWTLPGEPDKTAPGTALAFELWQAPDTPPYVRLRLYYMTLDQLRGLTPIDAAAGANRLDLPIPGCDDGPDGTCGIARLSGLLTAKLDAACHPPVGDPSPGIVNK